MRLSRFEYLEPKDIQEARSVLSEKGKEAMLVAGGTDILVKMKQRVVTPRYLVNLKQIDQMRGIEFDESKGLRIGALVTLEELEESLPVQERFPALYQAAGRVATPQLRNMGTIGGNICIDSMCLYYNQSRQWRKARPPCFKAGGDGCYVAKGGKECAALFQADTPPVLMALGAKVKVVGADKERLVDIEEIYTQKGQKATTLGPDEFIEELQIPTPFENTGGGYLKESTREAIDFPVVGVACQLGRDDGKCKDVRIALTAVASGPVRAKEAEEVLKGNAVTDDLIEKAAEIARETIRPMPHMGVSVWYKRRLIKVLVKRHLKQVWDQTK